MKRQHDKPVDSQNPNENKKLRFEDPSYASPQPSTSSAGLSPTISTIKRQQGRPDDSQKPTVAKKLKSDVPNLTSPQPSTSSSGLLSTEEYVVKKGTVQEGGDYEYMICALLALNLYFDEKIKDFSMSNNDNKLKKFDDVVVEITYENGEKETIAIQLKYISRSNKKIVQNDFKEKFNIEEHNPSKEVGHEYQNIKYLLYTNGVGDLDSIKQFVNKTNQYKIDKKNEEIFNKFCKKEGQKLRFSLKDDKGRQGRNYLYFCINQYSTEELKEQLKTILSQHFKHRYTLEMSENFCKFFELWSKIQKTNKIQNTDKTQKTKKIQNTDKIQKTKKIQSTEEIYYTRFKIQKSHVAFKLGIISLSPYIPSPNQQRISIKSEKQLKLLKEAFLKFNISICDTDSNLVSTMWKSDFTEIDYNDESKIFLNLSDISQQNLPLRDKFLLLWIQNKSSLVLNFRNDSWEIVKTGIDMCRENDPSLKFILCAPYEPLSIPVKFGEILVNLGDLKNYDNLRKEIVKSFELKLDGREPFSIEDIFGSEIDNLKAVTMGECIASLETDTPSESNEKLIKNYIPRKVPRLIFKRQNLDNITKDFVIVGCKKRFTHQNRMEVSLKKFLSDPSGYHRQKVIITTKDSINDFSDIQDKCSSFYYFEELDRWLYGNTLEWIASNKPSTLIQMERDDSNCIADSEFFKHFKNDINLILADPGMGKTVLIDYLSQICPAKFWPIKVIVRQHLKFLRKPRTVDEIMDYLIDNIVKEKWQKYAKQLKSKMNFIILWDGMDEFSSQYLDNLIQNILTLNENNYKQIVTSREFLKEELEGKLKVRHLTITPFNKDEQIKFIKKSLDQPDLNENEKTKIEEVIMDSIGIKRYRDILGIPLQLYLYVQVFISKKCLDNEFEKNNLAIIYKQFIKGKIKIIIEKDELNYKGAQAKKDNFKKKELIKYQKAAIISKFHFNLCQTYQDELKEYFEDIRTGNFENGIIINFTEGNQPLFYHETMAEYLIASFLKENWQNPKVNIKSFIDEVFSDWFTPQYQTIRYFFDLLLAAGHPLHIHCLNQDYDKILKNEKEFDWNECDEGNRSVLHLICGTGQKHPDLEKNATNKYKINKFKLELDKNYEEVLEQATEKCDVELKDNVLKMTCLEYAWKTKSFFEIELTLRENQCQGIGFIRFEQEQYQDYLMYYSVLCNYYEILKRIKFSNIELDGFSLLHLACENGHENVIDYLIKKGVDIGKTAKWEDKTPLHVAAKKEHYHVMISLIKNGANINACDNRGKSILHSASESGNLEMVKCLVERGADINQCDNDRQSILHSASESGNLEMVKFLVERGADINHCNNKGWSILHSTYFGGKLEIVKVLIESGADINQCNKKGASILHWASKSGNLEMVKFLVEKGADINVCNNYGFSILGSASKSGKLEIVKVLIESGADINHCDEFGRSILHSASKSGNLEMVKFLVERGADINQCDEVEQSILSSASFGGKLEIVKFLVEKGADINQCNKNGWSILHSASHSGNLEMVKFLVERGADINVCNNDGRSILHSPSERGNLELVKFLVEKGADIKACSSSGWSILHSTAKSGNLEMVKFLVEKGADIKACSSSGLSILHSTAKSGNLEMVKFLVEKGADIKACDNHGKSILRSYSESGNLEMVKFLVERGVDINHCGRGEWNILHSASESGNLEMVKFLVERGADINVCNKYGRSILHSYSESGNLEMVKFLVEKGADIKACSSSGLSILHSASESGNLEMVKFLVEKGADINQCDRNGWSILHWASRHSGDLEMVKFLVERGADIKACSSSGWSILHSAAKSGNLEMVKFLVERGVDINHCGRGGWSILHSASESGNLEMVKFLVERGADIKACDNHGKSILRSYSESGNLEMVKFLVERGADIKACDNHGKSILHSASESGNLEMVKFLVERGVDINHCNNKGWSILHSASESGNLEMVKCLVERGADINQCDNDGQSILHSASESGNLEMVKFLVQNGADVNKGTNSGLSVLNAAKFYGRSEIVRFLEDLNAYL